MSPMIDPPILQPTLLCLVCCFLDRKGTLPEQQGIVVMVTGQETSTAEVIQWQHTLPARIRVRDGNVWGRQGCEKELIFTSRH